MPMRKKRGRKPSEKTRLKAWGLVPAKRPDYYRCGRPRGLFDTPDDAGKPGVWWLCPRNCNAKE